MSKTQATLAESLLALATGNPLIENCPSEVLTTNNGTLAYRKLGFVEEGLRPKDIVRWLYVTRWRCCS